MALQLTFPKTVEHDKLRDELSAALSEDIVDQMAGTENSITLYFTRETTGAEDVTITNVVNAHVASHLSYKIWDYVVDKPYPWKSPKDLDYKKGLITRLHPKNTFTQGEMVLREYFSVAVVNPDGSISYSDLILKEENTYARDVAGFAISRQQTISWVREDESIGPDTKVTTKYYSGIDKIQEGQTRRGNLIDQLMMDVTNMMLYNETVARATAESNPSYQLTGLEIEAVIQNGRDLLTEYGDEFSGFINHSDKLVITKVTDDTNHAFLNQNVPGSDPAVTLRTYIIAELSI